MKKSRNRKIKLSILYRISILFLVAFILSTIITTAATYNYMVKDAARQGADVAKAVCIAARIAIGSEDDIDGLMKDEQLRDKAHRAFRYICQGSDVRYLYLYSVDENEYRHYIICAARSDEDDKRMNEDFGFNSVSSIPLYDAEKRVLNYEVKEAYEFTDNKYGDVCMFVNPVTDKDGRIIALIGVDYSVERISDIAMVNIRIMVIQRLLLIVVAFVLSIVLIRHSIILPISVLSDHMRNFVKDRENNISSDKRNTIFEDEISDIERSFDEMARNISQYVDDIRQLAGEKAQNAAQLDIARKIQEGFVPQECSLLGGGFEAYGLEQPAREVGGDFYDIFRSDDDNICIVVGDISGKGISAALFMIMVRTVLREKLKNGCPLDDTLNTINREICISNPENMFATVFAMVLDARTGTVRYANAGHEPPLIVGANNSYLKMQHGVALGLFDDSNIVIEELRLHDGEGILIYTDGVTETINPDKVQYGRDSLIAEANSSYEHNGNMFYADRLVRHIVGSVKEYSKDLEQFDDITCVALIYRENERQVLTPEISSFEHIKQAILLSLGDNEITKKILLVCEEIFVNIVKYSNADNVSFQCERMGKVCSVTFSDNGMPFDPVRENTRDKEFETLDTGGMGIDLVKKISNEMIYAREKNRNVLTLKFDINA